jgi:dipeptidyl-peptidase-4
MIPRFLASSRPFARLAWGLVVLLVLGALRATPTFAQQRQPQRQQRTPEFSLRAIHASGLYFPDRFQSGRWAKEGPVVRYIEPDPQREGVTHLVAYNLETDARTRLIDGATLFATDVGRVLQIEDYQYSDDGNKVLIYTDSKRVWRRNTKGYYYLYDLEAEEPRPVAPRENGYQMFAKFSPSGDRVAFVRERNLFVVDLDTMEETQLTSDGSDGAIINGTFDWVYEEEFGLRDGFRWGPEGRYLAFWKLDESATRDFAMTDYTTRYPEYERFRYPKAGEQNSEVQIGVIDLQRVDEGASEPESITYFDTDTWNAGGDAHEYLPGMGWTPPMADDGSPDPKGQARVWIYRANRDQNTLDLIYADPTTGEVETILQEKEETYIDIEGGKLRYLKDDEHFVWTSETSGYKHLNLYRLDGTFVAPITQGDWEVTDFHGIDFDSNTAYFTATRDGSTERHLYAIAVPFDGNKAMRQPERITTEDGWHDASVSRDRQYVIDTHSTITEPPTVTLRRIDGEPLTVLESNEALKERLAALDLPEPEFTTVPSAEDGTDLNAYLIKPTGFDSTRQYPLLVYIYGGPGVQTVTDQWGGPRHLWHLYLANTYDLVIASVDNRGTGGRGKAFQDVPYKNLGVPEAKDQVAAAQHLAQVDFIDAERVGIWGWSYGGYLTLMSMLTGDGPATFAAGISVAPVTDWRLYDTIYTERYMSTPQKNPEGYEQGAPLNYARRLADDQDLLLVHGDFDDNVHFQNSVMMANAFQAANKQFDFMMYPKRNHGIYGGYTRLHLFQMLTDFVEDELLAPADGAQAAAPADGDAGSSR